MKLTTPILCVIFGLLVFENKGVSSISPECLNDLKCGLVSILKHWQTDLMGKKSNSSDGQGLLQKLFILPVSSSSNVISTTAKADVRKRNETPSNNDCLKTSEDLITFLSTPGLVADTTPTKMLSTVELLTSSLSSLPSPLPDAVVVNLVVKFASTPQLFVALPPSSLNTVLLMTATTGNPCATGSLSANVRVQFLQGLFSLSPGALNLVPKSVLVPVLGTISSPDIMNTLSPPATAKLITLLSLSKSLFNCLPVPTLVSFLTSMAERSPQEILTALPPSTLFGFLDGLLDTVLDASPLLGNTIPTRALAAVIGPLMTSRMISVLPTPTLDLLLAVIGSSPELAKSLPVSGFVSTFSTLTKSPKLLSSMSPNHFAKMLSTVLNKSSVYNSLPPNLIISLLDSVAVYLPSCLDCIPISDVSSPPPDQK